jgi:SRSO17 transposase
MNIPQIQKLRSKLAKFLKRFDHCFPRKDTRAHLPTYITGQLSDLPEKSVEPIAIKAGVAPPHPARVPQPAPLGP